ncbi:MAG: oxygen-independent coproporphyrinogen III oxidase-like protein [Betaproteobacteria bacterium]|nr:oxygen-independent coproporphyrinogen III oxidase-like protein [Betaproteobacteria bacterium]
MPAAAATPIAASASHGAPEAPPRASRLTPHAALHFTALPPLALYIHIPWCVRKCPYCDFNSHEARAEIPEREYVAALIADFEQTLPRVWGRRIASVFFGGGTPSLLSGMAVDDILAAVRARLPLAPDAEITLEANPGTVEAKRFRDYRAAGVNRLSLGIQSFNPQHLKALGRIHDDLEARRAIDIAREHFDNFNLDVMYALPRQTLAEALADIEAALAFEPSHLSAYHLTLEPNTYFYSHPPPLPDDDSAADMQTRIEALLAAHGYDNYETSAFAQPGMRCRHNLNYWQFGDYIGIGAGAHGKISFPDRVLREARYRQPRAFMDKAAAGNAIQASHEVSAADIGFEFMMNALRLTAGFEIRLFTERAGVPVNTVLQALDQAEQRGLITRDHVRVAPTLRGLRFLNELLQLFLPDANKNKNIN